METKQHICQPESIFVYIPGADDLMDDLEIFAKKNQFRCWQANKKRRHTKKLPRKDRLLECGHGSKNKTYMLETGKLQRMSADAACEDMNSHPIRKEVSFRFKIHVMK